MRILEDILQFDFELLSVTDWKMAKNGHLLSFHFLLMNTNEGQCQKNESMSLTGYLRNFAAQGFANMYVWYK